VLLDDDVARAEPARDEEVLERRAGRRLVLGDDHALARGQARRTSARG
jgi:hypothetical protein